MTCGGADVDACGGEPDGGGCGTAVGAADPAQGALYSGQVAAVAQAAARRKPGPADAVAKAIVAAVGARKPKRRYAAGSGAAVFGVLAHLPAGVRERLIKTVFGLG